MQTSPTLITSQPVNPLHLMLPPDISHLRTPHCLPMPLPQPCCCCCCSPRAPLIAGSRNTIAIDAEGQLWSWGWNDRGTLGHGHRGPEGKPKAVAALRGIKIVQAALG
jgi:hypothetical protein